MTGTADNGAKRTKAFTCEAVAACLQEIMDDGLPVLEDVLFFADTTYGLGLSDLASALKDPDFEDRQVILKLVMFPDRRMRMAVEKQIRDTVFSPADEKAIIGNLVRKQKCVQLHVVDSDVCIPVVMTMELITHMVEKLYLCRIVDRQICAVLDRCLAPARARSAKVILRCRVDRISDTSRCFLCSLIERASDRMYNFDQLFELSLVLLAERPARLSPEAWFLEQKHLLIDTLKNIRDFERKRDQYGMEYLLMQRYQVPHESEQEVQGRLRLLSTITDDLFHLLPRSTQFVQQRDLGGFNARQGEDLEKLFRNLS